MMKRLTILLLMFASLTACSQTVTQYIGTKNNTVLVQGSLKVDSLMYLPGIAARTPSHPAIRFNPSTQKAQLWNGTTWEDIGTGASGASKVDSVTFAPSLTVDTVKYWVNGTATVAGYIDRKEGLISGGIVSWSGTGLTFDVSAAVYNMGGVRYTTSTGSITLDAADGTNPRIDVIALNTSGQIVKITGTPAASPSEPQVDPSTQLFLTSVHVAASATTPTGVSRTLVYDENTEWTGGSTGTVSVNFNGTTPASGTKSTTISSWSSGSSIHYTGAAQSSGNYTAIKLQVRLTSPLGNNQNISVVFVNGGTVVSNAVSLTAVGFVKAFTGTYQTITIPFSSFSFTTPTFDRIQLNLSGNVSAAVNIDVIELQGGITQTGATYTDAQARKAISLTTTGTSGAATYNNTTGVLNIPQYTGGLTNPMTAQGDMIYGGASGTPTRLSGGVDNYTLKYNGSTSTPYWAPSAGGIDDVLAVGQTFSANRTISTASFGLTVNATGATTPLTVSSIGATGLMVSTSTGLPIQLVKNPSTTNTVEEVLALRRQTSGAVGNGIGARIRFQLERTSSASSDAGSIDAVFDDASTTPHSSIQTSTNDTKVSNLSGRQVQTTDATPTTIQTVSITDETAGIIEVLMVGRTATTTGKLTGKKLVGYRKDGGVLTLDTPVAVLADVAGGDLSTATWTISASGNNIIIQATGEAAKTIEWKCVVNVIDR